MNLGRVIYNPSLAYAVESGQSLERRKKYLDV